MRDQSKYKNPSIANIHISSSENPVFSPVLWIFGLGEVVVYDCGNPAIQLLFALTSYLWIFLNFLSDQKKGIIYLFTFNILTLGIFNFWGKTDIISYWGIRVAGVSFNILFTALLTILVIIRKKGKKLFPQDKYSMFFYAFYFYTLIVGIITCLLGDTYGDNWFKDLLTFTPIIFYAILAKDLNESQLKYIVLETFKITIYALILAFILNKQFEYSKEMFIVGNTMSFLSPIGAVILWNYYSKTNMIVFLVSIIFLIVCQAYFACGKTIIMIAIILIWILTLNKRLKTFGLAMLFLGFPIIISTLDAITPQLENRVLAFKIVQVTQVLTNPALMSIAAEYSSMGNLIAEAVTLVKYYIENPSMILFGQGMGAGIPDYFGFLQPFAGNAGYAEIDAARNNYFNLHIAPYKVLANGGIIIFIWYCKILWDLFSKKNSVSFLAFLMLFLMFYVSKEFYLVTYCLLLFVNYMDINNKRLYNENTIH